MSKELKPIFRRYWIKVLPDDSCIAQFDEDGNYVLWDDSIPCKKVLFIPFSKEFADKVIAKGDLVEPSNLPIISFDIKESAKYHRNCTYRQQAYMMCGFCGSILDNSAVKCSRCHGRNWYYCDICDELKDNPIIKLELRDRDRKQNRSIRIPESLLKFKHTLVSKIEDETWHIKSEQILCPDCKEPRGLLSVGCIGEHADQSISHIHVLEVDGEKHFIVDYKKK
jgi:hypothetical protein